MALSPRNTLGNDCQGTNADEKPVRLSKGGAKDEAGGHDVADNEATGDYPP